MPTRLKAFFGLKVKTALLALAVGYAIWIMRSMLFLVAFDVLICFAGAAIWLGCSLVSYKQGWSSANMFLGSWLVGISIAVRIVVYFALPATDLAMLSAPNWVFYSEALRHHLGEYLLFTTFKPPLTYLIQALPLWLFEPKAVYEFRMFLILTFFLDIMAVWLIYLSAKNLQIQRSLAFMLALFYSISLIPFELWRDGAHYNHLTIFFTSLFIYSCSRLICNSDSKNLIFVSFAGALLLMQSTVNLVVVPVTAGIVIVSVLNSPIHFIELLRKIGTALLGPATVAVLLVAKNYVVAGTLATSNLAGPATMLVVQTALNDNNEQVRELVIKSKAPDWYLWCYDRPSPAVDENKKPFPGWDLRAQALGICYPWTAPEDVSWPFDFSPLHNYLRRAGQAQLAKVVEKDMNDARERRYLFAGFAQTVSSRWTTQYGKVSLRVYKHLLRQHPILYLKTVRGLWQKYFYRGAGFPNKAMTHLRTLPSPIPYESIFLFITRVFRIFAHGAYISFFICIFILFGAALVIIRRLHDASIRFLSLPAFILLSLPIILLSVIHSFIVGGENDRYFMQNTPYLMLIPGYIMSKILLFITHRRSIMG